MPLPKNIKWGDIPTDEEELERKYNGQNKPYITLPHCPLKRCRIIDPKHFSRYYHSRKKPMKWSKKN